MAAYSTIIVPLDLVLDRKVIIESGKAIPDVAVFRLTAAIQDDVFLHFGEGGDPVYLEKGWVFRIRPPEFGGLFVTNKAVHAGEKLILLIGYKSDE
jgi:hypothetical protein